MVKYQYAKDAIGKLIDINDLDEADRSHFKFSCISCGNELIARLGKVKNHHFAHKAVVTCSGETYLHLLGKQIFHDTYKECLINSEPFYIELYEKKTCNHFEKELGFKCRLDKGTTKFDLTKYFNRIVLETREGAFIPDVMLISKDDKDKIFIEIAVTHQSTEQKLRSKYRIIEIQIEGEEDFEIIRGKSLSVEDDRIKFKNFKPKDKLYSICDGNCRMDFHFLSLDKDGRCVLSQRNLKGIKARIAAEKDRIVQYKISNDYGYSYADIFKSGVAMFAAENFKVKNCFICRYHAENNIYSDYTNKPGASIFCKFHKIRCNSNEAVTCEIFKLDKDYLNNLLRSSQNYFSKGLNGIIDIEEGDYDVIDDD